MNAAGKMAVVGADMGLLAYCQPSTSKWVALSLVSFGKCEPAAFSCKLAGGTFQFDTFVQHFFNKIYHLVIV